jgi:hypothetical protein
MKRFSAFFSSVALVKLKEPVITTTDEDDPVRPFNLDTKG